MRLGIIAGDGGCCRQDPKIRSRAFEQLHESDPVSLAVEGEGATELRDEVISSGSLAFRALGVPDDPWAAGRALTRELAVENGASPAPVECDEKPFSQEVLIQTARLIAGEVNDYTDTDGQDTRRITGTLSEVLQSLELDRTNGKVITARAEVPYNLDETRHLTTTLFFNSDTHKAIAVLTSEGHM